ncbi:hypothetical protein U9M48_011623 [Paspalum notatum var. saurae]|uniref:Embryo defective 2219 n=1 Tax=Paspalum notatum var. saurae TaxID=547442 RepID=A0AAQ3SW29_PASNO
MAAALPHSHLRLHLPLHTPSGSSRRRHRLRLPSLVAVSRLQNPTTATQPAPSAPSPPPPPPSSPPRGPPSRRAASTASRARSAGFAAGLAEAEDAVLRRALEVRRAVAAEALVAALGGGKVGGLTYIKNLTARMGLFVDRIVVEAAAMRRDRPELAHMSFNARAKAYIQESGLVELVKWFKHNSMTYPQIAKVVCSCSGDLEKVRRMIKWLRSIYVKGDFLGRVLANGGSFLNRSFEELEEVIGYLESCGVRRDWIGYVVSRCPQLLNLSMDELEARVRFYTDMGMDEKDFGTMVYDYPRALGFLSMEEMNSKAQYLKEFGLSTEELGKLLAFKPQLMACSIEERWKPLVKYLYHLNISRDGMKRMLMVQPTIFCLDLETVIAPKVIFLLTKGGVKQKDIGKVIALDPQLLGCSIAHKLEISVKYLRSLGIYHFVIGQMVADFPTLLRYNVDILKPKYQYLRRVMPLTLVPYFCWIASRFFSYSLEDRIVPRHQTLVENRVNMKLRYMLTGSDEEFAQRVQEAVERRARFEAGKAGVKTVVDAPEIPKEEDATAAAEECQDSIEAD